MIVISNILVIFNNIYYWWETCWTKMYTPTNSDAGVHKTSTLIVHTLLLYYLQFWKIFLTLAAKHRRRDYCSHLAIFILSIRTLRVFSVKLSTKQPFPWCPNSGEITIVAQLFSSYKFKALFPMHAHSLQWLYTHFSQVLSLRGTRSPLHDTASASTISSFKTTLKHYKLLLLLLVGYMAIG